jgi:hypothetical protein
MAQRGRLSGLRLARSVGMNPFLAALNTAVPHFRVRGEKLFLSQGHPFTRIELDLRQVAAHKLPSPLFLHVRLLRGRWMQFRLDGFRPSEITRLRSVLTQWQRQNHQRHDTEC